MPATDYYSEMKKLPSKTIVLNKNSFAVLNTNKYINKHYSSGDFSLKVRKIKDLFNMKGHIKCSLQQDKNQQKQNKAQRSEMQEQLCSQSGPPTPGRPCTKVFSKERPRKEWLEHNLYLPGWRKLRGLSYTLVHLALPVPWGRGSTVWFGSRLHNLVSNILFLQNQQKSDAECITRECKLWVSIILLTQSLTLIVHHCRLMPFYY